MPAPRTVLASALLALLLTAAHAQACTTFYLKDAAGGVVFGKNLDYSAGSAHVSVNQRGLAKTSRIAPPERPVSWTSRYGSVTFDMLGKEFAQGGMNEAGLVIESLLVSGGKYEEADERPGLIMQQWIQYQMDTAATVQDVIASNATVRMSFLYPRVVHFLVGDRQGNAAVIEYVDGKIKAFTGPDLPIPVLTNSPYQATAQSVLADPAAQGAPFAGNPFENSRPRFALAAALLKDAAGHRDNVARAFSILDAARLEGPQWGTRWSIVYDIAGGRIHYKTAANAQPRVVDLADFDFSCARPALYADIDAPVRGRDDFLEYSTPANRALIERSFESVQGLRSVPAQERDARAAYAASVLCAAPR